MDDGSKERTAGEYGNGPCRQFGEIPIFAEITASRGLLKSDGRLEGAMTYLGVAVESSKTGGDNKRPKRRIEKLNDAVRNLHRETSRRNNFSDHLCGSDLFLWIVGGAVTVRISAANCPENDKGFETLRTRRKKLFSSTKAYLRIFFQLEHMFNEEKEISDLIIRLPLYG